MSQKGSCKNGKSDSWFLFNSYKCKQIRLQTSKNRFKKSYIFHIKNIKYSVEMPNNVYFYYFLLINSKLIYKMINIITHKPLFSPSYDSCTLIEDFTVWRILILTNPLFIEFLFLGPGFQIFFQLYDKKLIGRHSFATAAIVE